MRNSDSLPQIRHRLNPEDDRIALYVRLTSVLRSRIATGEWKVGLRIPSIEALCTEYGVARNTVRQALEILSSEGLIRGGRGVGTFVLQAPAISAIAAAAMAPQVPASPVQPVTSPVGAERE